MSKSLEILVEKARKIQMSGTEKSEQRISFAFGTAKIENDDVTREMAEDAATSMHK